MSSKHMRSNDFDYKKASIEENKEIVPTACMHMMKDLNPCMAIIMTYT